MFLVPDVANVDIQLQLLCTYKSMLISLVLHMIMTDREFDQNYHNMHNLLIANNMSNLQISQLSRLTVLGLFSQPHGQVLISHCEPSNLTVTHGIQSHSAKSRLNLHQNVLTVLHKWRLKYST